MSAKKALKPFPKGMAKVFSNPVRNGLVFGTLAAFIIGALPVFLCSIIGYQLYKNVWLEKYKNSPSVENVFQYFLYISVAALCVWVITVLVLMA